MRRRHEEDGAVLVFTIFILTAVIAFGAIAVDAGALYQEHRELQNGADAAALAIAQSCSEGGDPSFCAGGLADVDALAEEYADPNAEDDLSEATVDLSLHGDNTVIVETSTIEAGQTPGNLTMFFARVFGVETGTTTARAKAKWGSPVFGSLGTLPLVISACEYIDAVGVDGGGGDGHAPWDIATNGAYDWLVFHGSAGTCAAQAGQDTDGDGVLSGGFGWVDTTGSCSAILNEIPDGPDDGTESDYEGSASTGTAPSQTDCPPDYVEDNLLGETVFIPVFTDLYDVGTNGTYVISYYAAYYIAGYNFGGQYKTGISCPGGANERCIAGWFTTATAGAGQIGNGPDTGVRVYALD